MKKIINGLLLAMAIVLLVGCGGKEETKTFTTEKNGVKTELVYTYTGDKVTKQSSKSTIPYSAMGVETKDEAKEMFASVTDTYKGVKGIDYKLEYGDKEATEQLTVDYSKADTEEISKIPGIEVAGDTSNGISMEKSEKLLKEQGYKVKE